ncbi:MAG: hypothetical protein JXD21_01350 [Candidatus Omnitrophica bacterium]|nr:hypothetical protein [Candidatus Omnitrophota bacterium]
MAVNSFKSVITVFISLGILLITYSASAAVGCTLNDPERDLRRIFPESTGYKTSFHTIEGAGREGLKKKVESLLNDRLDPVYEAEDVPYAYYDVLKGKEVIGRVHGINQKGAYGGIQIILATDLEGNIVDFYYQRISSPQARYFRDESFTQQFIGLGLEDLYRQDMLEKIKQPTPGETEDFFNTLRGIKKNLILLDAFYFDGMQNSRIGKVEKGERP